MKDRPAPLPKLSLAIDVRAGGWRADLPDLSARAEALGLALLEEAAKLAPALGDRAAEASLVFASDADVAALNEAYRGRSGPTNVLSFPSGALGGSLVLPPDLPVVPLGDVILAHETTAREARAQGKQLADHASHLIVHGLLHLLGFDHRTEEEARVMEGLERTALARFGIGDPYACEAEDALHG